MLLVKLHSDSDGLGGGLDDGSVGILLVLLKVVLMVVCILMAVLAVLFVTRGLHPKKILFCATSLWNDGDLWCTLPPTIYHGTFLQENTIWLFVGKKIQRVAKTVNIFRKLTLFGRCKAPVMIIFTPQKMI
jgi:hypothetical protein